MFVPAEQDGIGNWGQIPGMNAFHQPTQPAAPPYGAGDVTGHSIQPDPNNPFYADPQTPVPDLSIPAPSDFDDEMEIEIDNGLELELEPDEFVVPGDEGSVFNSVPEFPMSDGIVEDTTLPSSELVSQQQAGVEATFSDDSAESGDEPLNLDDVFGISADASEPEELPFSFE